MNKVLSILAVNKSLSNYKVLIFRQVETLALFGLLKSLVHTLISMTLCFKIMANLMFSTQVFLWPETTQDVQTWCASPEFSSDLQMRREGIAFFTEWKKNAVYSKAFFFKCLRCVCLWNQSPKLLFFLIFF